MMVHSLISNYTLTLNFNNNEIIEQVTTAMDILESDYPEENHIFAYDNAKTHTARAPDALTTQKMTLSHPSSWQG